ncbi:MAG TPA: nuclease A inhibitor family protein [Flavisolibacter sp.]|nr:nuclease A inhibitor family protein [Flavisolibacter sp.]
MNPDLQQIKKAVRGLKYMSESFYPFKVIQLPTNQDSIEQKLQKLAGSNSQPVLEITFAFFFQYLTQIDDNQDEEERKTALRFRQLRDVLLQKLKNIKVYKLGQVEVSVFIIGELSDGTLGGLRTTSIET